jgi:hypothetical protein
MGLRHLEWLIGEPVPDAGMVVYEVLPYGPAQADRVIEQLWCSPGWRSGRRMKTWRAQSG